MHNDPLHKTSLINLSIEEQNLAGIPFAVLERRVGTKLAKIELEGTKTLADGTECRVTWQVQGNPELGLPTEQDLDIFVALGVLTFQNNFQKTVVFSGREMAQILNIHSVHGKFYQRLKLAFDRFVPLRFRAITETDRQEDVKWLNVFQEASFSLDRSTGRCSGSVTWTDKLIRSMDCGFFRFLDAGRYMKLDGITAKHLYRYLATALEKQPLIVIDARTLARQHLGILNPPKYLSRLMQTLEPAFEQLIRIQVLGSYHTVSADDWTLALHRHPDYVPESRTLMISQPAGSIEMWRTHCRRHLEKKGLPPQLAANYSNPAETREQFLELERAGNLLEALREEEVLPQVAVSLIRKALDGDGADLLDWCEIAVRVCRDKRSAGQQLKNPAGFLIKLIRDPEARRRFVSDDVENSYKRAFRQREQAALRQQEEAEQQTLIVEYEQFRQDLARRAFGELPETNKKALRRQKEELLRQHERFERIPPERRQQEADDLILQDLARHEAPAFEKWRLRRRAQQAMLPFEEPLMAHPA